LTFDAVVYLFHYQGMLCLSGGYVMFNVMLSTQLYRNAYMIGLGLD